MTRAKSETKARGPARRITELSHTEAREHLLSDSVYFSSDVPSYLSFEPLLKAVDAVGRESLKAAIAAEYRPQDCDGVNYKLLANKDGRFAWRPYELMHPVLYVLLVDEICSPENWKLLHERFQCFSEGLIESCSLPLAPVRSRSVNGAQVLNWWNKVEQRSIELALDYRYVLHTDVADCYGSLYTHSIGWALHGKAEGKQRRRDKSLLGNFIDDLITRGRWGQTNGIGQGSGLMDLVAELVLGWVDLEIDTKLRGSGVGRDRVRVLRYRDDYRIFANSERDGEEVLKAVSECLREVGMKLSTAKTKVDPNIIEGSLKPDKLAAILLEDLGTENAKTLQKQLLRIHAFGQRYPNSGALRRLMSVMHKRIESMRDAEGDLAVQISIATDIGFTSPSAFPAVAGVLSDLLARCKPPVRSALWEKLRAKMARVPNNGYLDLWLQRVHAPAKLEPAFESQEPLCKVVNGEAAEIWNSEWIKDKALRAVLDVRKLRVHDPKSLNPRVAPSEVDLFSEHAWSY